MISRFIRFDVKKALQRQAAVALIGRRQVGKTTLALEIGREYNAVYLDLEDRDDRRRLANPALFLNSLEDRLAILDEIHRMPSCSKPCAASSIAGGANKRVKGVF